MTRERSSIPGRHLLGTLLGLLVVAAALPGSAQSSSVVAALKHAYALQDQAYGERDVVSMEETLAPDFRFATKNDQGQAMTFDRAGYLRRLERQWGRVTAASRHTDIAKLTVAPNGREAIVIANADLRYAAYGQNLDFRGVNVDHWKKVDGRWLSDDERALSGSGTITRGSGGAGGGGGGMSADTASQWGMMMFQNMMMSHQAFRCSMGMGYGCR